MIKSRRLLLLAGQAVDGMGLGRHPMGRAGRTQTFREHRGYVPGDDLRHVDWHVLARKDQLAVKVFEDEAPIRVELVVDTSGSMGAGNKLERQQVLALAVAQVALAGGEEVGLHVLGQSAAHPLRRLVTPAAGGNHAIRISEALAQLGCGGQTPWPAALAACCHRLRRRSHIMCFSDFWCDASALGPWVHKLTRAGHDVTLVHLMRPEEQELPQVGQVLWQGLEDDGEVLADSEQLRDSFSTSALKHRNSLVVASGQGGGVVIAYHSTAAAEAVLRALLSGQSRRGRR